MADESTVQSQLPLVWEQLGEIATMACDWRERGVPVAQPAQLVEGSVKLQILAQELLFLAVLVGGDHHADG
ncbi:hypothetical protein [Desulfovibrio subterraneus]|uniref:Uncharacterized protein n=1 Tax=Desulfovibrio subterraneus TaxID=2718620 RepID=A0A7J0BHW2_9BACT|nr:hypothetical protein [Desulfovibrio subterraneus]GFM33256.1 hypothetical protein DSM101010T_16210 [Desulfovibrio subterraneus]